MALFEAAVAIVLQHEGGFANVSQDRGGPTNFGISTPTLSKWLGRPATLNDVQNMTIDTAQRVFRAYYWNVIQGDNIAAQPVANAMLDMAVLLGPNTAVKMAQSIVGATQDGKLGPKTLAAINNADPSAFLWAFSDNCSTLFAAIVDYTPSQLQFLKGWVARACAMRLYLLNGKAVS